DVVSYRSGPANWVDARRGITLRDRDERSSLAIHVCFLRETGSSTSTTRNMEETGVLEKVNLSGFCYLALNQVRHGHADRTAPNVSIPGDETDQEVFVFSRGLAVFHWHADHLVAGPAGTVPRAMLGGKRVEPVLLRELAAVIEGQVERRRVRLNKHVGNNHLVLELGVLSLVPGPAKIPCTYERRFESSPTSGRRTRDESHHHQGNRDCWPPATSTVRPSKLPAVRLDATRLRGLQGRMFAR